MKDLTPLEMALQNIVESALSWYFIFAAWASLYVAMSYAKELRAADRRAAAFAREAQEAQLRARRSEEHTSELQSLMLISYAVSCLKKKKTTIKMSVITQYNIG